MDFDEALREFAGLLTIGAAALRNLIERNEPIGHAKTSVLLAEVDEIASRLSAIAGELQESLAASNPQL